ncbi:MAG TPA: CBS domain-containing protein [Kofleriaceae bacterium]|nr:CBS domain-containing protein [Kofleriaceae bacterium]
MSTALITVGPKDSVNRADLEMKLAGIRHFPVVDARNHLVGVVSDRDLLRGFAHGDVVSIDAVMTTDVQTVSEETSAAEAVELLLEHKFGCLPVTGDEGQLVGLVTETDFLQVAYRALMDRDELGK